MGHLVIIQDKRARLHFIYLFEHKPYPIPFAVL